MPTSTLDSLLAQRKQFLAFVQRRVSDSALAEDILQTAYLRAFEHRDYFKPDESAVAWFYRLLRNAVIDTYRRQASRNKALETWTRELEISAQPSPDLQDEVCACLHGVIESLKPQYREALRAVDLGEERVQDFAEKHSLSASNAGVRLHRARAALRKQLVQTCGSCAEHGCLNCICRKHKGRQSSGESAQIEISPLKVAAKEAVPFVRVKQLSFALLSSRALLRNADFVWFLFAHFLS